MKIAVPNNGDLVNQHFGKSKSFIIATIENNKIVSTEQISSEQFVHNHEGLTCLLTKYKTDVVIIGGIGLGALESLKQNGLKVVRGATGNYIKAIEEYIDEKLQDKNIECKYN
ncbi:NifB/NifX family molybdenum-iron cluster-binding protein [Clostridium felsineum]|uniref:NifB/NifX family molybdenum-iron cluster-binding protein n=1 Tax=Clostridium felsineum TaxID=36839 RepID=UPI00098C561E|nr:NifB/NifX family molybdenum-iron cluster-binding protein [Clostridium felsineum]URZ18694.1 hypothetical protein CLFE_047820 [Clostridium felsineum DSM 794]